MFYQEQVAKRVKNSSLLTRHGAGDRVPAAPANTTCPTTSAQISLRLPFEVGWFTSQVRTYVILPLPWHALTSGPCLYFILFSGASCCGRETMTSYKRSNSQRHSSRRLKCSTPSGPARPSMSAERRSVQSCHRPAQAPAYPHRPRREPSACCRRWRLSSHNRLVTEARPRVRAI